MISIKKGLYHLSIYSKKIHFADYFIMASYTSFLGSRPVFFKKHEGKTSVINLLEDMEKISSNMKSNYRNEIKKAISLNIDVKEETDVNEFIKYYNNFAIKRGLSPINEYNVTKYPKYVIFKASLDGSVLTYHVHIYDEEEKIVRLLYSASNRLDDSIDTKAVGFANKYLHYKEFEYFKAQGLEQYDFAGVCDNPEDKAKYGIGLFKKGFGGEMIETVSYDSPLMAIAIKIKELF